MPLSQAFTDHPQTAMKQFMVFITNSDILPHIIEQALRQRASSSYIKFHCLIVSIALFYDYHRQHCGLVVYAEVVNMYSCHSDISQLLTLLRDLAEHEYFTPFLSS